MSSLQFSKVFFLTLGISLFSTLSAQPQPPIMGWASWNHFHMDISHKVIQEQADAMVNSGLKDLGYNYINIDDGFFDGRYANGALRIDSLKFPNGMKAVADYIHAKGLKAGFYTEAGANTCGSMYDASIGGVGGGLYGHDQQDMDLFFKNWGFDFLKVDYCGAQDQRLDEETRYTAIRKAMDNTGVKGINLNACRWEFPGTWITKVADSWRIFADIKPEWRRVCEIIDANTYLAPYASPGHYNDMDMLEVGRGMTHDEDKAHFSMWCLLGSPLVLGNDLKDIPASGMEIIANKELIAINQDISGEVQARLISEEATGLQVWAKKINGLQSADRAVVLLNRTNRPALMSVSLIGLDLKGTASIRDLWAHKTVAQTDSTFTAEVPAHGAVALKITGKQAVPQKTFEAEYAWVNNFNLIRNGQVVPGQGKIMKEKSCSGGGKVSWLGNSADNFIEFRNILINRAGTYQLTLHYVCSNERDATITINGKQKIKLRKLCSHDWKTIATATVSVPLQQGENTIRIFNAKGWLPDLDRITIRN
ncbi:MAG: alpha-galactosidase [Paludibacter sp.]